MDRHTRKRNKALTCSFFAILAFIFSLVSCDNFNKPVREYFDYYTNTAGVMDFSVPESIGKYAGMNVIESNGDKEVYLYLRNPKKYLLNFEFKPDQEDCYRCEFSPEQDSGDRSMAKITLRSDILQNAETSGGFKNISGNITVRTNDGTPREFASFPFSLMVNSAPPPVKSPILQLDAESGGKYILCFFVPITSGSVHEDTKKIFINNDEFKLDSDGTVKNADGTANSNFSYTKPSSIFVIPGCDVDFDSLPEITGYKKCFYKTGIPQSDSETKFTITLKDDYNFTSSANVSNKAKRLAPPMILNGAAEVASGSNHLADGDTKQLGVIFKHWGKNIDHTNSGPVTIYYEIEKTSAPQTTITGHKDVAAFGSTVVNLSGGTYTIRSWVTKPYSIDSEVIEVTNVVIKEPQLYYVANAAGGGSDEDSHDGSKNKPFASFKRAFEKFAETSESSCEIRLKTDLTPSDEDCETSTNAVIGPSFSGSKTVSIRGWNGTKTIDMSGITYYHLFVKVENNINLTLEELRVKNHNDVDDSNYESINNQGTLILNNCIISDNEGSGIYNLGELTLNNCTITRNNRGGILNSGELILKGRVTIAGNISIWGGFTEKANLVLMLSGDNQIKISDITELSSESKISVKTMKKPQSNMPTVFIDDWPSSLGNPWNILESDASECYVDFETGTSGAVALKKQGAQIAIGGTDILSFQKQTNANDIFFTLYRNNNPATGSISVISKTLKCGADTVPQDITESTVHETDCVVYVDKTTNLHTGSYVLYLSFTYNGQTYEAQLPFTK